MNGQKKAVKQDINRLRMVLEYRWDPKYQLPSPPEDINTYQLIKTQNILHEKIGKDLQAIFINLRWNTDDGITIDQFKQLQISDEQMSNGMIFIWCEKDNIMEIIDHLDKQAFNYVENFTMVMLSQDKILSSQNANLNNIKVKKITDYFSSKKQVKETKIATKLTSLENIEQLPDQDPIDMFLNEPYPFFRKTKRTLLMFRKISKQSLELRHQRTGDIFFDVVSKDSQSISPIGQEYIYKMIETLLPKAKYMKTEQLKMMELFASPESKGRVGWIQVIKE